MENLSKLIKVMLFDFYVFGLPPGKLICNWRLTCKKLKFRIDIEIVTIDEK